MTTTLECPKCHKAVFSASIVSQPAHYLLMVCQGCNYDMMFAVDLSPICGALDAAASQKGAQA